MEQAVAGPLVVMATVTPEVLSAPKPALGPP